MRRFIKNFSLFVFFCAMAYLAGIVVTGGVLPRAFKPNILYKLGDFGHLNTRIREVDTLSGSVDILFLGSSHSYRGIDTRQFKGFKTFNLGSSSQSPLQTAVLLDRYLDKLSPKMVVYEVYPFPLTSDGVESSIDLICNARNDLGTVRLAMQVNNIKVYNTLIYGITRDLLDLNASYREPLTRDGDTYIPGGFVERKMEYFKHVVYPKKQTWQLSGQQMAAFQDIIKNLRERNIKLMLVYAPITTSLYHSYTNNGYIDSLMQVYGNGNYINFNGRLKLDDSLHFYNAHHLNQRGVELFDQQLLGEVEKFFAAQGLTRRGQ